MAEESKFHPHEQIHSSAYDYSSLHLFISAFKVFEYPTVLFNPDHSTLILSKCSHALMVNFSIQGNFAYVKGRPRTT